MLAGFCFCLLTHREMIALYIFPCSLQNSFLNFDLFMISLFSYFFIKGLLFLLILFCFWGGNRSTIEQTDLRRFWQTPKQLY